MLENIPISQYLYGPVCNAKMREKKVKQDFEKLMSIELCIVYHLSYSLSDVLKKVFLLDDSNKKEKKKKKST